MERFYDKNDKDDENEDDDIDGLIFGDSDDDDDFEDEEEGIAFIDQQGIIDVMQMDLAQVELNQQLLGKAMEIAKQNWLWYFKSANTRMKDIEMIYQSLLRITERDEEK